MAALLLLTLLGCGDDATTGELGGDSGQPDVGRLRDGGPSSDSGLSDTGVQGPDDGGLDAGEPAVGGCARLLACCDTLTTRDQRRCRRQIQTGDDALCNMAYDELEADGFCMDVDAGFGDAGQLDAGRPDSGPPGPTSCSSLADCCPTLGRGPRVTCAQIADQADALACHELLVSLRDMGMCLPGGS